MRIKESELTNLLNKVRDLKELIGTDKQRIKIIESLIRYQNFLFADKVVNLKKWKFYDLLKKAKRLEALNPAEKFFIQKIHNWTKKFEKDSTKVVRLSENDLVNLNQNWSNQRYLDQDSSSEIEILNDKAKYSANDSEHRVSGFKKVPEKLRNILSANKIEFGTFAAQVLKIEEKYFVTLLEKVEKCENLNEIDKSYLTILGNWISNKSPWFISEKASPNCE